MHFPISTQCSLLLLLSLGVAQGQRYQCPQGTTFACCKAIRGSSAYPGPPGLCECTSDPYKPRISSQLIQYQVPSVARTLTVPHHAVTRLERILGAAISTRRTCILARQMDKDWALDKDASLRHRSRDHGNILSTYELEVFWRGPLVHVNPS